MLYKSVYDFIGRGLVSESASRLNSSEPNSNRFLRMSLTRNLMMVDYALSNGRGLRKVVPVRAASEIERQLEICNAVPA